MIIVKNILSLLIIFIALVSKADNLNETTDNRIKEYIYNPNETYLLVLQPGFISQVDFSKDETIETVTIGNPYAVQYDPKNNRLNINPLAENIITNMVITTVIPSKKGYRRTYIFDLVTLSKEEDPTNVVYAIKFIYPNKASQNKKTTN